jgi:hypothetical protein
MSSAINTPIMPNARRSLLRNEGMHQGKAPIVGLKSLYQAQADDMLSTAKGCTSNAQGKAVVFIKGVMKREQLIYGLKGCSKNAKKGEGRDFV